MAQRGDIEHNLAAYSDDMCKNRRLRGQHAVDFGLTLGVRWNPEGQVGEGRSLVVEE